MTTPNEQMLRERTEMERQAKKILAAEGVSSTNKASLNISILPPFQIQEGVPQMANKRSVGTLGKKAELDLQTNVYGLYAVEDKKIYRYEVSITGTTRSQHDVDFTGKISNE